MMNFESIKTQNSSFVLFLFEANPAFRYNLFVF
ncbi:hypothetical protein FPSM_01547 [Flavobacterium psychrophilum]|nr:hypothetical protein FPSM_01547 [Flavobacterium psychrophilum]